MSSAGVTDNIFADACCCQAQKKSEAFWLSRVHLHVLNEIGGHCSSKAQCPIVSKAFAIPCAQSSGFSYLLTAQQGDDSLILMRCPRPGAVVWESSKHHNVKSLQGSGTVLHGWQGFCIGKGPLSLCWALVPDMRDEK